MEVNFTLEQINETASEMLRDIKNYKTIAFTGEMGAGKTTFIHALCKAMGTQETLSSPTFSIINHYRTQNNELVYHIDLYRLKDEDEAINAGVEDCLYSGNICFVEWPQKASGIFPENTLFVYLTNINDNTRKLKYNL